MPAKEQQLRAARRVGSIASRIADQLSGGIPKQDSKQGYKEGSKQDSKQERDPAARFKLPARRP